MARIRRMFKNNWEWSKRLRRSRTLQWCAYLAAAGVVPIFRTFEARKLSWLARAVGDLVYVLAPQRRAIALNNLRTIYRQEKSENEIKRIARESYRSLLLTVFEGIWFRDALKTSSGIDHARNSISGMDCVLERARTVHAKANGCIFVTPHFGNYQALPILFSVANIPLVIPLREIRNEYIHRRWCPLNQERWPGAEVYIPRKNSLNALRNALREGQSVGIMPDQRTMRGLSVEFFGRPASTTPIPAMLAVDHQRPIVVGACYRRQGPERYSLILGEPIWPEASTSKKVEMARLTKEMNRQMESIIRACPEQYFWIHNRWKPYRAKRAGPRNV